MYREHFEMRNWNGKFKSNRFWMVLNSNGMVYAWQLLKKWLQFRNKLQITRFENYFCYLPFWKFNNSHVWAATNLFWIVYIAKSHAEARKKILLEQSHIFRVTLNFPTEKYAFSFINHANNTFWTKAASQTRQV